MRWKKPSKPSVPRVKAEFGATLHAGPLDGHRIKSTTHDGLTLRFSMRGEQPGRYVSNNWTENQ